MAGWAAAPLVVERPTGPGPSPRASGAAGEPAGGGRTSAGRPDGSGRAGGGAGRAGRDLVAAFTVGGGLAAAVLASLLLWRPAFLVIVVAGVWGATWELVRAVRAGGARPPQVPLFAGGLVMVGLAWWGGLAALSLGLLVSVLAAMVWRLARGPDGYHHDVGAATLILVYVPFLGGFAALLAAADDGTWRVLVTLVVVVLTDTGGYATGVFLGRHPMAPTVSPKKSWEGLAGSLVAAAVGGAVGLALGGLAWWVGVIFGVVVAGAAVLGDLAESLLKRDLGIKDMSGLLPGHGGVMDRVDSILFAVPTAYLLLEVLT